MNRTICSLLLVVIVSAVSKRTENLLPYTVGLLTGNSGLYSDRWGPVHFLSRETEIHFTFEWRKIAIHLATLRSFYPSHQLEELKKIVKEARKKRERVAAMNGTSNQKKGITRPIIVPIEVVFRRFLDGTYTLRNRPHEASVEWSNRLEVAINSVKKLMEMVKTREYARDTRPFILESLGTTEIFETPDKIAIHEKKETTVLSLKLALYGSEEFVLFRQYGVPVERENVTSVIQPETPYIAVKPIGSGHKHMESAELEKCVEREHRWYCRFAPKIHYTESCESALAREPSSRPKEECKLSPAPAITWVNLRRLNEWLFAMKRKTLVLSCPSSSHTLTIDGSGLLRLGEGCQITDVLKKVDGQKPCTLCEVFQVLGGLLTLALFFAGVSRAIVRNRRKTREYVLKDAETQHTASSELYENGESQKTNDNANSEETTGPLISTENKRERPIVERSPIYDYPPPPRPVLFRRVIHFIVPSQLPREVTLALAKSENKKKRQTAPSALLLNVKKP